jgi:TolB-like protein
MGSQIASAVEAAHERGIVHRDLKPGNVMISTSNAIKVLDFGLAKGDPSVSGPDLSVSPTAATAATADGIVLGTAPYMSPEQARGKPVDKRTDVWAFGCVLMECLSGRQTFAGETVSDVIAMILERDPDWNLLPPGVPVRLGDLIRRCLTKDVERRPRDIGDLGRELQVIAAGKGHRAAAKESVPSLAVLYFENLARDPDSEYFCSGITEDILTDLSKIGGLRVASKNAVSRYRGRDVDVSQVGRDLGVKAILEGSVRRAGDRIRITAQLINAADGFQLWAERYDRTLDDVFAVQDEIAKAIVEALRVAMTPSDVKNIARDRPADARAYDLYLKGREQYGLYREEAMRRALDLFKEATVVDPGYALAWAGTADCYGQMLQWGWKETDAARLGLEAAEKAVALDPKLAEGHKAQALVLRNQGDSAGARRAITRAIQANPNFTPALINLAVELFSEGNLAGAERLIRRVLEIDPQEAFGQLWLGWLLMWTQRYDEGLEVARKARGMSDSGFYVNGSYVQQIMMHLLRGDAAAADETVGTATDDDAVEKEGLVPAQALVAAHAGRIDEARKLLAGIPEKMFANPNVEQCLVGAAVRVGEPDLALRALDLQPSNQIFLHVLYRLNPDAHAILDREPLAPRKSPLTLVWPLQAPMIDEARFALFRGVRIESGKPEGSNILGDGSGIS